MKADNLRHLSYAQLTPEEVEILKEAENRVNNQRGGEPVFFLALRTGGGADEPRG